MKVVNADYFSTPGMVGEPAFEEILDRLRPLSPFAITSTEFASVLFEYGKLLAWERFDRYQNKSLKARGEKRARDKGGEEDETLLGLKRHLLKRVKRN